MKMCNCGCVYNSKLYPKCPDCKNKENKNMSCTGDKPCNCQMDTPYTQFPDNVMVDLVLRGFENEKPGEKIKRKVNNLQDLIKYQLNNLIDELGIHFGEMEINLNDEGNKIESVYVFWHVDD